MQGNAGVGPAVPDDTPVEEEPQEFKPSSVHQCEQNSVS